MPIEGTFKVWVEMTVGLCGLVRSSVATTTLPPNPVVPLVQFCDEPITNAWFPCTEMPVTTAMPGIGSFSSTEGDDGLLVSTTMTMPSTPAPLTVVPVAVVLPIKRTSLLTAALCQTFEVPSG